MRLFFLSLAFLLVLILSGPIGGYAQDFQNIVAFGDSFTDNGHIDGHGFNRDTNGLVWVEYLAEMIGGPEVDNRAWGGARTDNGHYLGFDWSGFNWQVDNYEMTTDPKKTLFTVWIGVNDYWDNKDDPSYSVKNIRRGLNKLIGKGAEHLVVFNNFDLTLSLGYGPDSEYHALIPAVRKLTVQFNQELDSMLFDQKTGLSHSNPGIEIYFVDIHSFMKDLVSENEFNETPWKGSYEHPDPEKHLWYDEWHPMTSCHKLIAEMVLQEIRKQDDR